MHISLHLSLSLCLFYPLWLRTSVCTISVNTQSCIFKFETLSNTISCTFISTDCCFGCLHECGPCWCQNMAPHIHLIQLYEHVRFELSTIKQILGYDYIVELVKHCIDWSTYLSIYGERHCKFRNSCSSMVHRKCGLDDRNVWVENQWNKPISD